MIDAVAHFVEEYPLFGISAKTGLLLVGALVHRK